MSGGGGDRVKRAEFGERTAHLVGGCLWVRNGIHVLAAIAARQSAAEVLAPDT